MTVLKDVIDQAVDNKAVGSEVKDPSMEFVPFQKMLYQELGDVAKVDSMLKFLAQTGAIAMSSNKDVVSVDLGAVRATSLFDVINMIVNPEHKLLKMLLSRPQERVTDLHVRIPEEDIGAAALDFFNMDGTLPDAAQTTLSARNNTAGALGQQITVSMLAQELAAQGPYQRNEFQKQFDAATVRINRAVNLNLWDNTEVTAEAVGNVPQPGGFATRSTANVAAVGGGNLTDALISGRVSAIAASFGYDALDDLVGFTNAAQIPIIRNLMINRNPGTDPMSKLQYDNVLMQKVQALGLDAVQMIYEDNNGKVVPFVRDEQMPSGTTLLCRAGLPRMGQLYLNGKPGYHLLERPNANLYRQWVYFVVFTLLDPLVSSRGKLTGHA